MPVIAALGDNPMEMKRVEFISLEEDDKDLIVSFAVEDENFGVKSLILHRTLFYEEIFDEEERGVKVSMEGENLEYEHLNMLQEIRIGNYEIEIVATQSKYMLDISRIDPTEIAEMIELVKKQNHDDRFVIHVA